MEYICIESLLLMHITTGRIRVSSMEITQTTERSETEHTFSHGLTVDI